jgi:squalene synthase HpnC
MPVLEAPALGPGASAVMARARGENFPVASRVLPRAVRGHLLAVYGFARLVDELGDSFAGDREAALASLEAELDRAFEGRAEHPLMVRLQGTIEECALSREPFARLIEANRTDQRVSRYETWEQLQGYCRLSANPVGEIVLGVLGKASGERIALSDAVCTALQLTEHIQDVAEDAAAGRIYLPAQDLQRFGSSHEQLIVVLAAAGTGAAAGETVDIRGEGAQAPQAARVAETIAFEVRRAHSLFDEGQALIGTLRGRERMAVAAFIAGGRAALAAVARARFDVRVSSPRASRARRAISLVAVLAGHARR